MVRTQIQLPAEQVALLKHLAEAQHTSMAEIIRRAVTRYTLSSETGNLAGRRERILAVAGQFRSGRNDIAAHHDDYLAEAYES